MENKDLISIFLLNNYENYKYMKVSDRIKLDMHQDNHLPQRIPRSEQLNPFHSVIEKRKKKMEFK